MQAETIPLEETDCFSPLFLEYISEKEELSPFYHLAPSIANFGELMASRNFAPSTRKTLVTALNSQYQELDTSTSVRDNIEKLASDDTFTITTGHQLNIFTGPLYFIYKIVTAINTCKALKKTYPDKDFVPVYWMASEDHDYEEIKSFFLDGESYKWDTNQTGAVGRFDPKGLLEIVKKLPEGASFFKDAYQKETLAKAVQYYVNYLFSEEGLVIIDADDPTLKKVLQPVMEDDLFIHHAEELVAKTSSALAELGHKPQVHARQINFFYLHNNIRERLERTKEGFQLAESKQTFSEDEIRSLIKEHPDRFSPNVILRPLYQELILPNLAYVGGPSEATYWLQLKAVFDHFSVSFPALMPRNFAIVLSTNTLAKWNKTGLSNSFLFQKPEAALTAWIKENSQRELSLEQEVQALKELQNSLEKKVAEVDSTLISHVAAIFQTFENKIQGAEKKLLRAEKRQHTERQLQIASVHEKVFPKGVLQERKVNFQEFYLRDPHFIKDLLETLDPFVFHMNVLTV